MPAPMPDSKAEPEPEAWKTFCREMAKRYRGKVRFWEVWNEPDVTAFFPPKYGDWVKGYMELVRLTAPAVGVPVADAWYALHRREYAETLRRESLAQAAAAEASGSLRPREGGRASGGELLGTDPRHMTAAQRAELRDRIKRGERVYPR